MLTCKMRWGDSDGGGTKDQMRLDQQTQASTKPVGKLNDIVLRLFGQGSDIASSLSRSSSDTGSEGAICNGGPGKKNCGNPVRDGDVGVQCDWCNEWFHAACQGTPKVAIRALERHDSLAWLCTDCKSDLKKRKEFPLPLASLESKVVQLGEMIQRHSELAERSAETLEQTMRDHAVQVEKSLQAFEKRAREQVKAVEMTASKEIASYADAVKGTCHEVANMVKTQLAMIPKPNPANNKSTQDLSKVLDDHMDRE